MHSERPATIWYDSIPLVCSIIFLNPVGNELEHDAGMGIGTYVLKPVRRHLYVHRCQNIKLNFRRTMSGRRDICGGRTVKWRWMTMNKVPVSATSVPYGKAVSAAVPADLEKFN